MSTDLKLCKAQISKIIQSGGFIRSLLSKLGGLLMKVAIPLAKNILALLGITAAASAIDAEIKKKTKKTTWFWNNNFNSFNEEMNEILKIAQALEDSNILLKGVTKNLNNETKEQEDF